MPAASAFADLLDARTGGHDRTTPAEGWQICTQPVGVGAMPWWPGAAVFGQTRTRVTQGGTTPGPERHDRRPCRPEHVQAAAAEVTAPPRPARNLTPAQRDALATLSDASDGGIDASFTADELKRAFRRAARQTHPDAHPGASADQRRFLGERFSRVRRAYLTLRPLA